MPQPTHRAGLRYGHCFHNALRIPTYRRIRWPGRHQVAVEPRPDGRWAVQTDGTQRADSLHDKKSEAIARGRELAGNKRVELVLKNEAGRVAGKASSGIDPRRIQG